jgi:hypothetical protein
MSFIRDPERLALMRREPNGRKEKKMHPLQSLASVATVAVGLAIMVMWPDHSPWFIAGLLLGTVAMFLSFLGDALEQGR